MTSETSSVVLLALRVGRMAVSSVDVPESLGELCRALPSAMSAADAVIVVTDPEGRYVQASSSNAAWIGELQRRSDNGPVHNAVRSGRPMITEDLTRVGPPELAAAAAECGFVTSVVVPLVLGEKCVGGLQLLGDATRPVGAEHVETLRPLVEAITARLVDALALRLAGLAEASTIEARSVAVQRDGSMVMRPGTGRLRPLPPPNPGGASTSSSDDQRTDALPVVVAGDAPLEPPATDVVRHRRLPGVEMLCEGGSDMRTHAPIAPFVEPSDGELNVVSWFDPPEPDNSARPTSSDASESSTTR